MNIGLIYFYRSKDLKLEEPFLRLVNNNNLQTLLNTDQSDTEVKGNKIYKL